MPKKKKKKKIKYEPIETYKFNKSWVYIFNNWDGKTHKKYKDKPIRFIDEKNGKTVINKKKKSLRPMDVFMLEMYPDKYTNKKTKTEQEIKERRERILAKQTKKFEQMQEKNDKQLWKDIDYSIKHPNEKKEKLTKSEKKIMDFFNKRNGVDSKQLKQKQKEMDEKYNKMDIFEFAATVEVEKLKAIRERAGKKGWVYGYTKKGKRINPNKSLAKRQMKRYVEYQSSKHAIDVFKETLVEEIEARLMYDPFNVKNHPVIEYNKYSSNIDKKSSKKQKSKIKENNKIKMGRLII